MECSILSTNCDDYGGQLLQQKIVTARKSHKCTECGAEILRSQKYEVAKFSGEGTVVAYKTCLECLSVRGVFFTNWCYSCVWEDVRDMVTDQQGDVSEACISKLTRGARVKVLGFINEYYEKNW